MRKIWLILILLIIPTFINLVRPGYFWMQDDLQAFRIHQIDKCLQSYEFPCRWAPDAGYQYGYPQFIYYPPSVYYLGEIFHLIGLQFIDSVKLLFILGFVLSAVTMFIFLRSIFGIWPAFVGAILYTYAPYKAVDVYVRGALSEFWSFVFFPLIFWAIYQLIKTGKLKYLAWEGFAVGLLLLTHNLMSMIFLPVAAVWGVTWLFLEKRWKMLPRLIAGGLLGLGLAAFFTFPVIGERSFAHTESMLGGYFDYRQHFVDISQLFFSNHWGYGSSYLGPNDDLALSTGIIHWVMGLLAVLIGLIFFKKNRKIALVTLVLAVLDLSALFLTHQKSSFIWERLSFLVWLQFPWRILADSVFLLSILGAITIFWMGKTRLSYFLGGVVILMLFILHLNFFQPHKWFDISDKDKFSGQSWQKQLTISIFDYLPIYAKLPPTNIAPEVPEILEGEGQFTLYEKGADFQKGTIRTSDQVLVRLPLFDFPGMRVLIDGKEASFWHDDCRGQEFCLGLITFNIPKGEHIIEARLGNTPVRVLGNVVSVSSVLFLIILFWRSYKDDPSKNTA